MGLFEQICWDIKDIYHKPPSDIYIEENWYVCLSYWVNLMNERQREVYNSYSPAEAAKNNVSKYFITSGKIFEDDEVQQSSSSHTIVTLEDKLNERNRKSINKTHS